ncbi:MAG TPA: hypothetical protein VMT03_19470 [Polyangia bacterium]|nr:hypothetical protein [Polyangia bacterium]
MTSGRGRRAITILLAVSLALSVAGRLLRRTPTRHATTPAPFVHPIVPSAPVINPPPPSCRARDLQATTAAVRQLRDSAAAAAGSRRPPARNCHDQPETRAMEARIDLVAQAVSGCVARDAELDGAWNLVQSAVLAVQSCADCAAERAPREKACDRATELVGQAERDAIDKRPL